MAGRVLPISVTRTSWLSLQFGHEKFLGIAESWWSWQFLGWILSAPSWALYATMHHYLFGKATFKIYIPAMPQCHKSHSAGLVQHYQCSWKQLGLESISSDRSSLRIQSMCHSLLVRQRQLFKFSLSPYHRVTTVTQDWYLLCNKQTNETIIICCNCNMSRPQTSL